MVIQSGNAVLTSHMAIQGGNAVLTSHIIIHTVTQLISFKYVQFEKKVIIVIAKLSLQTRQCSFALWAVKR